MAALAAGAFELRARGIRADSDGAAEHRDITVGQKLWLVMLLVLCETPAC